MNTTPMNILRFASSLILALALPLAHAGTITITPVPLGGTVTSNVGGIVCGTGGASCVSTNIVAGTSVTLTATPDPGYAFTLWTIPGFGVIPLNPATQPMPPFSFTAFVTFAGVGVGLQPASKTLEIGNATSLSVSIGSAQPGDLVLTVDAQPAGIVTVPASVTILAGQTTAPVGVTAISNGTATVSVTLGAQNASSTVSVIPVAVVPDAPTIFIASATSSQQATIEFEPPVSDGGSDIFLYTAKSSPGNITASAPGSPIIVNGLTNGTTYTFTVTATNSVGEGVPSSPSDPVTPNAFAPGAPQGCTAALSGPLTVTVSCAAHPDGGSPIISYTATSSPGGITGSSADPAAIPVAGLTRGTDYTFTVTATNAIGTGPSSDPTNTVNVAELPGAPTNVVAVAGNGSASLTWSAPADDGGSMISSYSVYASPGGFIATNGGALGMTVTLPVGVPTSFTVRATNVAGEGPASLPSNTVTATASPPGAPTRIHAMGGDGRATVSFLAPASNGGSAITSYHVTVSPGGAVTTGSASPIDVPGLANGAPYTFTVAAVNLAGTGASSSTSNVITPAALAIRTTPYAYVACAADGLVAVIDTATRKVINTIRVGQGPVAVAVNAAGTRAYVVNTVDLTVSVIDTALNTVVATVFVGAGPNSIAVNPQGTRVLVGNFAGNSVSVIDTSSNQVVSTISPIQGPAGIAFNAAGTIAYVASPNSSSIITLDGATFAPLTPLSVTLFPVGLALAPNGTVYAVSASGGEIAGGIATLSGTSVIDSRMVLSGGAFGVAVSPTTGRQYAAIPGSNLLDVVDGGALSAATPVGANPHGVSVTPSGAHVYVTNQDDATVSVISTSNNTVIATIPVGGTPISFGVFVGPDPVFAPGAPTSLVATPANGQASVSFLPPSSDGGTPITSYTATSSPGGFTATGAGSPLNVGGLTNGTPYTFTVTATNVAGAGPASAPSNSVTPRTLPGAPLAVVASPGNGQATIVFSPPASNGGAGISSYTATCTPGPFQASAAASPITVTGLANFTAYSCSVTATNAAGTGPASVVANVTPAIYALTVAMSGTGTGTVTSAPAGINCGSSCGATYIVGTPVTLTASAASRSAFAGWSGACAGTGSCQVTMNAAQGVTATFNAVLSTTSISASAASLLSTTPEILTATVSGGSGAPTGTVIFRDGATDLGSAPLNPGGQAALSMPLAIGNHSVTANYQGDNVYNPSSSSPVSIVVADGDPPRLGNISTRMQVLTGSDVMIAGFIVGGSTPKRVVVNVAGPNLARFGVLNALADPKLTLVRISDNTIVAANDDWEAQGIPADVAALIASGLQPNLAREPAIIATLAPGAYTAIVEGAGTATGVALVGVFELDHPEIPLINISTRGQVLTGGDVMIAGFIIQGSGPRKVVINVAGPNLVQYGVTNALADPTLTLVRVSDNTIIASNDNWGSQAIPGDVIALTASGFQPNNPLEPAIIATLPPGAYTAIVSGVNGTSGVGLVGVFVVP